jgi:hypothetical protein
MKPLDLITALAAACDAMRRSDPTWCLLHDCEQVTDVEWDDALALAEDALDAQREAA